jgi:imidazolonepropionase-like amidohydrolase
MLLVSGVAGTPVAWPQTDDRVVAFINVNVIPMDTKRVLPGYTVLVRGDRIVHVGPAAEVQVPAHALRVEGAGKYLMPGLGEMHAHIPSQEAPQEFTEAVLFLYVANGVTTARGMLGAPNQFALRDQAHRGEIVSPTLYLAGPSFSGRSIKSPEEAIQKVRQQKHEEWDMLKIHPGLTREAYDAMATTAQEVGMRFVGHVPADVGLLHALEMGQETIDHVDGYVEYLQAENEPVDDAKLADVVQRTKQAGTWIVPTMAVWETLLGARDLEMLLKYAEVKYMPPQQVEQWRSAYHTRLNRPQYSRKRAEQIAANRKRILKALHDGGVRLLFGTDAPQLFSVPGFSIHREMAVMRQAGLTPYDILHSGTKHVGDYFTHQDNFGAVAVGQRADLILVNGNPLEDIANIAQRSGVMVRGRWLPEAEIQERLAKIEATYRTPASN